MPILLSNIMRRGDWIKLLIVVIILAVALTKLSDAFRESEQQQLLLYEKINDQQITSQRHEN